MDGMPKPKHAIPAAPETRRRDHLWVLFLIAACVLAEVWASWVGIGAISGFPVIKGKIPTDWVLAVAMEAYWGYALYAWLVASPGPKSRAMAMWSCGVVFALSLAGQVLYHELTVPPGTTPGRRVVIGFVTSLPVIVLALIAVLIHMRHADREDAQEAARREAEAIALAATERAEADERAFLRRELANVTARAEEVVSDLRAELDEAQGALASARREAAEALARADALSAKLAAASDQKPRKAPAARSGSGARSQDEDLTTEARALMELAADPSLKEPRMGGELARRLGVSPATGRRLHARLTAQESAAEPLSERTD